MSPAHEENNRGLEEVLSNGTVPQSNISRPTFTGYSKQRTVMPQEDEELLRPGTDLVKSPARKMTDGHLRLFQIQDLLDQNMQATFVRGKKKALQRPDANSKRNSI